MPKKILPPTESAGADILASAQSEVESLIEELQSWRDNLPENLQNGSKADQLDEAISSLESTGVDSLEIPDSLEGHRISMPSVKVKSRSDRAQKAAAELQTLASTARDKAEEHRAAGEAIPGADQPGSDRAEERDAEDRKADDLESFADEAEAAAGELESVEFPGAFGS